MKKKGKGKSGFVVLGGNQKLKVIRHLIQNEGFTIAGKGGQKVPVVFFEGTEKEAEIVVLRDNLHSGDWDYVSLGEHLKDLENQNIDATLAGFDRKEVDDLKALAEEKMDDLDDLDGGDSGKDKGLGKFHTFRFKVPKGDEENLVKQALELLDCEHDESLVRLARIALEHPPE